MKVAVEKLLHLLWQQRFGDQFAVIGVNGDEQYPEIVDIQLHPVGGANRQHALREGLHRQAWAYQVIKGLTIGAQSDPGTKGWRHIGYSVAPILG